MIVGIALESFTAAMVDLHKCFAENQAVGGLDQRNPSSQMVADEPRVISFRGKTEQEKA